MYRLIGRLIRNNIIHTAPVSIMMSSAKEISQASSETGGRLPNVQEKGKLEAEVAKLQAQIATRQAEVEAPAAVRGDFGWRGSAPQDWRLTDCLDFKKPILLGVRMNG